MKPFIVVQGPIATRSGYGNHTRDLVSSLIKADKYEVQVVSMPWGTCPMNALEADNSEHQEMAARIARGNITRKPDVFIQISVPNEFTAHGKYNIGVTAGIETTAAPVEFIAGANNMDLILTTSEHSKNGFAVVYDKLNKQSQQKEGEVKLEKPIEVLFEGVDTNVYKKTKDIAPIVKEQLSDITDEFCYLFVGHWLKGDLGHDRKDIGMMIKTICEAFKRKATQNRPGIILKTSHATFSIMDRDEMFKKIQSIIEPYGNTAPNIYLLHGDLTDNEMNSLYNHPKVKAMVSFTKGEGYGRPLAEFGMTGKPILASNWSGHIDFLKYATLLPGQLLDVHPSAQDKFIQNGTQWFTVNYAQAANVLQDCINNYKKYVETSRKQPQHIKDNFSLQKMKDLFVDIIDSKLKGVPQQVSLKLPKLKKANKAKPILKLPKLKKATI